MIEIKLSKKWCNRTAQALSLPFKPFYTFNDFLEDKIGDGDGYGCSISVLLVWMQIFCTVMGSSTLLILQNVDGGIEWDLVMILTVGFVFLMIPIGIVGMYLINIISNNISISCRCEDE